MKKLIVTGVLALVAAFLTLGLAPAAEAYPETSCNVTVDGQIVKSGASFSATGVSEQFTSPRSSAVSEVTWKMTFNGELRKGSGVTYTQKFKAPVVKVKTKLPLTATALMPDKKTTCSHIVDITIVPGSIEVNPPVLPNTGGPRLILLLGGFGLIVAGGIAIRQSRRSHGA